MTTLLIALGPDDFKERIGGWECRALSIPFARLDESEVLDNKGQKLPQEWTELSPEFNGGVVRWKGPSDHPRPSHVTLHMRFDETGARRAEKKEKAFVPALVAVLTSALGAGGFLTNAFVPKECPPAVACSHAECELKSQLATKDLKSNLQERQRELDRVSGQYEASIERSNKCMEVIRDCRSAGGKQLCTASGDGTTQCGDIQFGSF